MTELYWADIVLCKSQFPNHTVTLKVKVKVKFTLEQVMQAQRVSRSIALSFFNLCAKWGWVVNATPQLLYPQERAGTYRIGGWVGLRAGLDSCGKYHPHRDLIPGPSSPQRVAIASELAQLIIIATITYETAAFSSTYNKCGAQNLLLLQALQLQGSFGLLNEFFPFWPVSDAVPPVCYFHICYITLYIILPPIFTSSQWSCYRGWPLIYFFCHAIVWHTVYVSKPG